MLLCLYHMLYDASQLTEALSLVC